ncbi:MAG: hypothetical protein M1404_04510 [Acidobacteria bacterium]|nr:hypothetical protein [Acidobacteriota bacterium]
MKAMNFFEIEAGLTVLAVVLAFAVPTLGSRWFEALERRFGKLAEKRGLSVIVVGLTALALRAALLPILPIPVPAIPDEYCYLLLSDTFAHGRLTNPSNPMWVHFESVFTIWHPTYTTKFYPAQGMFMAFGQVVLGHPFWGVWLSVGLMCATITWMLQGWLEPSWALLGGFLAAIRLGTFSYWANSYFGGAVTAIGGALVLGALPRMKQQKRVRHALLMGLGFAIIANSRPYEGLFFGIPVAIVLLAWLWKLWKTERPALVMALKRVMAPLLAVIALTLVAMGYYFWRTTGTPFNTPYLVNVHRYDPVPYFPWQSAKPMPNYRYPELRSFYLKTEVSLYRFSRTYSGWVRMKAGTLYSVRSFFLGYILLLPLVVALALTPYGFSWRDMSRETRFFLAVCGAVIVGNMLPIVYLPHYSAAITGAILGLVLIAMRYVRSWQCRGRPAGAFITRAVPSVCVLLLILRAGANPLHLRLDPEWPKEGYATWCSRTPKNYERAAMLKKLRQYPGRQLAIVHYSPDHDLVYHEWVCNRAELNKAKVIWAHDMGPAENEKLIKYFKDRHVWLVEADDHPPRLLPYSATLDAQVNASGNLTDTQNPGQQGTNRAHQGRPSASAPSGATTRRRSQNPL